MPAIIARATSMKKTVSAYGNQNEVNFNTSSNTIASIPISRAKVPADLLTFITFFYILEFLNDTLKVLLLYDLTFI